MSFKILKTALCAAAAILFLASCSAFDRGAEALGLRDQAVALYKSGDYEAAIEGFNAALEASRGEVSNLQYDILMYRAECELRAGDYEAARADYDVLLELEGEDSASGEYGELFEGLERAQAVADACALAEDGDYRSAYAALSGLAELGATAAGECAWYNMAICAEYLSDYAEAYDMLSQYLLLHPDDEEAAREAEFCRSRAAADEDEASGTS